MELQLFEVLKVELSRFAFVVVLSELRVGEVSEISSQPPLLEIAVDLSAT